MSHGQGVHSMKMYCKQMKISGNFNEPFRVRTTVCHLEFTDSLSICFCTNIQKFVCEMVLDLKPYCVALFRSAFDFGSFLLYHNHNIVYLLWTNFNHLTNCVS